MAGITIHSSGGGALVLNVLETLSGTHSRLPAADPGERFHAPSRKGKCGVAGGYTLASSAQTCLSEGQFLSVFPTVRLACDC